MPQHLVLDNNTCEETTMACNEQTLLQRIVGHDEQAFATLYSRYAPILQRTLRRTLQASELVDEVLDDVMLVLWQDAAQFPSTVPLGAWLQGIARHKALKALRRQATTPLLRAQMEALTSSPRDPEALLLEDEQEVQLRRALAAMPSAERVLLEKLLYQGCSYQEMAEQTGALLNTVKARICRGKRRLAALLGVANAVAYTEASDAAMPIAISA